MSRGRSGAAPPALVCSVRRLGPGVEQLPDEALLAGLSSGDEEIAAAFVRRFQSRVFGVALAVLGDPRSAEDVAQQAFERAWRHSHAYDPLRGSVTAWLTIIARNLAIDAGRVRRPVPVEVDELMRRAGVRDEGPERAAVAEDSAAQLRVALRRLPAEQARAVVLAGLAGMSASQIALSEGIPLGTAKTRIRSGMHRLRAALVDAGYGDG